MVDGAPDERPLFETLMADARPPLRIRFRGAVCLLDVPPAEAVARLDDPLTAEQQLFVLLGDQAGALLERLSWVSHARTHAAARAVRRHFRIPARPDRLYAELVHAINTYGSAIEADLFDRGWDLLDYFRGVRPWPQLLRLIGRLPEGSRHFSALLDDEDLARFRIEQGLEAQRSDRPPLLGETPERRLLRELVDEMRHNSWATFAAQQGKKAGAAPKRSKHPQTAEERIGSAYARQVVEDIFDQATPGWRQKDPLDSTKR